MAEELSFTRAAKRLRISQPSLTRTVTALERMLGTRLLDRTTRQVALTGAGDRFKDDVARVVREFDAILDIGAVPATLRLGFTWRLPGLWTQQVIHRFERRTRIRVELVRRDEPFAGVDVARTDVAVLRGELVPPGMQIVPLFRERRVAAVRRNTPLADRPTLQWGDLADRPLVVPTVNGATSPTMWPAELRPVTATECPNLDEWLEAVATNRGVGVAPISAAYRLAHPAIRFVALEGAPLVEVYLAFPRQGGHPLARQFASVAEEATIPPHTSPPAR